MERERDPSVSRFGATW